MIIPGTVAECEEWAALRFPASGSYVVSGAPEPVEIDVAADRGRYVEPNVWMHHRLCWGVSDPSRFWDSHVTLCRLAFPEGPASKPPLGRFGKGWGGSEAVGRARRGWA